jgi:NTE family protein
MTEKPRVGLVLAGGGARGAYEAGALSVLLPFLERRGERPTVLVGTSVGAINAAYLAASRHVPAARAAAGGVERWREVTKDRVVRPILGRHGARTALRYAGELLAVPGVRVPSLLDPAPLSKSLPRWVDFNALHRNVSDRVVDAVAAVATAAGSGRTVVFTEGETPPHRPGRLDYARVPLEPDHVRASAAIPLFFPAVRVERPARSRGGYFDGGSRLNTPIKPAIDLGVDRLAVVGTASIGAVQAQPDLEDARQPDICDGALNVLQGMLVDPLAEDLRTLGRINEAVGADGDGAGPERGPLRKHPYRQLPYMFIGPQHRGEIGRLALDVFRRRYGGIKGLRSLDFPLLNRLLGGETINHGELLSYLFFDPAFIEQLIALGRHDARRWIDAAREADEPWQIGPLAEEGSALLQDRMHLAPLGESAVA